jgi:hypothetical protein
MHYLKFLQRKENAFSKLPADEIVYLDLSILFIGREQKRDAFETSL